VVAPAVGAASPSPSADEASTLPSTSPIAASGVAPSTIASIGAPAAGASSAQPSGPAVASVRPLVFAYYYIWYTSTSWRRAKTDLPRLGTYDSRDRAVVAQQMAWMKDAGIDGLIVSWKHERGLDAALRIVVDEATKAGLKLVLLYQGLDFDRQPLDPATVASDLQWFLDNYATAAPFDIIGRPMIVWSGTWGYKDGQIANVRKAVDAPDRALLLGSERSADAYTARATLFDGDAYYWSSPDPLKTPRYQRRLNELAAAVRQDGGRWIAPAAPGFDARLIGGTSIVDRRDGATFRAAWAGALQTSPDILGVISWNEFSENSYIEPSKTYGDTYLQLTKQLIASLPASGPPPQPGPSGEPAVSGAPSGAAGPIASGGIPPAPSSTAASSSAVSNSWGVVAGILVVGVLVAVGRGLRRRSPA
jgi:Glycosyl hydrolase family 99